MKAVRWALGMLALAMTCVGPVYGFDNWLTQRDKGVVRQQRDYSCGAAALATLLTHFYGDAVSEDTLLEQVIARRTTHPNLDLNGGVPIKGLSFAEMARLARTREYPVLGLNVSYSDLKKLKIPVIVALNVQGRAHFSVLRKIDQRDRVFLADPSWGNRQWGRSEFLQSFTTVGDSSRGRILLVGAKHQSGGDDAFRHRSPRRVLIAPRQ